MPPDTNRGTTAAGGWLRLGGRKPAASSCRDEVATAFSAIRARTGQRLFTVREVREEMVKAGTGLPEPTVSKTMQRMKAPLDRPPCVQLYRDELKGFRLVDDDGRRHGWYR